MNRTDSKPRFDSSSRFESDPTTLAPKFCRDVFVGTSRHNHINEQRHHDDPMPVAKEGKCLFMPGILPSVLKVVCKAVMWA
jgi:hypothetical protein